MEAPAVKDPSLAYINFLFVRCPLIAQHLKVEVATFHFDSVELVQVLSQIRTELFSKAQVFADSLPKQKTAKSADSEEIVMLKPNIHGIGVDLRALWRKATRGKS
jgi:hypothetical protein